MHAISFELTVASDRQHRLPRRQDKWDRAARRPPAAVQHLAVKNKPQHTDDAPTQRAKIIPLVAVTAKLKSYYSPDESLNIPRAIFLISPAGVVFFATRRDGTLCSPYRGTRTPRCSWSTFRKRPEQFGDDERRAA